MVERMAVLRRKLDALAYAEPVEAGSAALVERLVADLVATTESWRGIKLRDAARGQQLAEFQAQVRPFMRVLWHSRPSSARRSATDNLLLFQHTFVHRPSNPLLPMGRAAVPSRCQQMLLCCNIPLPATGVWTNVCVAQVLQCNTGPLIGEKKSL